MSCVRSSDGAGLQATCAGAGCFSSVAQPNAARAAMMRTAILDFMGFSLGVGRGWSLDGMGSVADRDAFAARVRAAFEAAGHAADALHAAGHVDDAHGVAHRLQS